eukprot:TRINITY_DN93204_c0_g1_i1.p1 TRINITY_DN93204_c0_g1~~TRINITY_DN93204_c0_g1_i1.p1  ORF type:complete len:249 (+),score=30.21 TRINITY_DN93204_c0_g1_i1:79-747(+)
MGNVFSETIIAEGPFKTKAIDVEDYTDLSISHGIAGKITTADSNSLSITAQENVIDFVEATVQNGTLILKWKDGYVMEKQQITATITRTKPIGSFSGSGGSRWEVDSFCGSKMDLSGGSQLSVKGAGATQIEKLAIDANGGSGVIFSLPVGTLSVNGNGGSHVTGGSANNLELQLSGGSYVKDIAVSQTASGHISGGGQISLGGTFTSTLTFQGGSALHRIP